MVAEKYQPEPWIAPAEYLERERTALLRSEYVNGRIYAMAGASSRHVVVCGNAHASLHRALRGKNCQPFMSDMRVRVAETTLYTYAGVRVACPPVEYDDSRNDTLINPVVIIEVLSPSTESYDRGDKWAHYQRLVSLRDCVLVSQDQPRVEHYSRAAAGDWLLHVAEGLSASITLTSVDCTLLLSDIYERLTFDTPPLRAPHLIPSPAPPS